MTSNQAEVKQIIVDWTRAICEIHCDGTSAGPLDLRLTVGLEKRSGEWLITP